MLKPPLEPKKVGNNSSAPSCGAGRFTLTSLTIQFPPIFHCGRMDSLPLLRPKWTDDSQRAPVDPSKVVTRSGRKNISRACVSCREKKTKVCMRHPYPSDREANIRLLIVRWTRTLLLELPCPRKNMLVQEQRWEKERCLEIRCQRPRAEERGPGEGHWVVKVQLVPRGRSASAAITRGQRPASGSAQ